MSDPLFIGVDGGATKARARIRDAAGAVLGEGTAGAANARLKEPAFAEVMKACRAAAVAAGLGESDLGRLHAGFGLAGTQQAADRDFILSQPHPFASVTLDTDAYAAYMGAHGGRDGAILIVGTGTCGLASIGGTVTTVAGWGADIADEGSGMDIGRTAIRRSLWALEGMAPMTPLAREVLARFDSDPGAIVDWAGRARPADYGTFAPMVFAHAEARDALATGILSDAAKDVTRLVSRLLELGAPTVAMIGGIFPRIFPWLAPPVRAVCVEPLGDAADGAILMARRAYEAGR
ncbi:MAG TPA: BadF/BadG/BcrA/BcrD ATPase family protein [Bauldia sp.]|nr:BadF/BadG/BcrA/BcrD ATPase family protein [Bauldia sp.]